MTEDYISELEKAMANLADLRERGAVSDVDEWQELKQKIFSPAEIKAMNLRIATIKKLT